MKSRDAQGTRITVGVVDVVVLAPSSTRRSGRWRVLTLRRAAGTRCPGAWEIVHGSIEPGETPTEAAVRELREETGCVATALYCIAVNPFYLHQSDTMQLAVAFAAIVEPVPVTIGVEHDQHAWRTPGAARKWLAWPREHVVVTTALHLLAGGDAGPLEDVLRIPRQASRIRRR